MSIKTSQEHRLTRHRRVRRRVSGTAERPRLAVYRSNRHIYAQIIDDVAARTIASASTVADDSPGAKKAAAAAVGKLIAERAMSAGVEQVVFDRGGFRYHGRVAAIAEAAREAGLKF